MGFSAIHTMQLSMDITYMFLFIHHVSGKLIQAAVGYDVMFALTEECKHGTGTLHHHLKDGTDQLVAVLNRVWKPGPSYSNRVNQSGDSVILTSADFNDDGHYAFACNRKQSAELDELHVFLPSNTAVLQGQDATLTCRSITAGQRVKFVRWRRNGEVVLELNAQSGHITYGNGFNKSRVSIPSDWDRRADMSLTIKQTEVKDWGVYYCDVDKTEKHRSAVHLQILLEASSPPPGTPSHTATTPKPPECPYWTWAWPTFFITAATFLCVIGLLVWLHFRIVNGGGRLCLCNRDMEGGSEENRNSDSAQQTMLTSNGHQ